MKRALLATIVAGAFAVPVFAQTAVDSTVTAQAATPAPNAQRSAPRQHQFRMPSERIEARLAYLKTALKITDAQQAQWDNFANVLRTQAREMDKRIQEHRAEPNQPRPNVTVTAIDRLERMEARMQQRAARLNDVIGAAKPLYASFTPEQKQIADQMVAKAGHRHGHRDGRFQHRGPQQQKPAA